MSFFDYTSLIGRGVGTAIGMWFGGPAGAQAGGMAGEMEGGKIGQIGKGEADWTSMLSPGPAQPGPQDPYANSASPLMLASMGESAAQGNQMANDDDNSSSFNTPYAQEAFKSSGSALGLGGDSQTPSGESGGADWGKILQGVGRVFSATAAGYQGDNDYINRFNQQMDQQKNTTRALEQRDREQTINTFKAMPEIMDSLEYMAEVMGPEHKTPEKVLPFVEKLNKTVGMDIFTPESVTQLLNDKGSREELTAQYEVANDMGVTQKRQLLKYVKAGKSKEAQELVENFSQAIAGKHIEKDQRVPERFLRSSGDTKKKISDKYGDTVFTKVKAIANQNGINKDISRVDFEEMIPNANLLSDDHLAQLRTMGFKNLKSGKLQEAEETSDRTLGRQQETQDRQDERQQRTIEQQNKAIAASDARSQNAISAADARADRALQQRQIEEERRDRQQRTISPAQTKQVTGIKQGIGILDSFQSAHDELMKTTDNKKLSSVMKGALAKNQNANTVAQIGDITGNTPAEQKFAAEYNSVVASIKQLTDEVGVLTDEDALRILKSFNPATTPEQFKANLSSRRKTMERALKTNIDALRDQGKIIPPSLEDTGRSSNQTVEGTSKSGKPIISTDGGKTWKYK